MKVTALVFGAITFLVSLGSGPLGFSLALAITLAFGASGVLRSRMRKLRTLNDIPNGVRVAFASMGGWLAAIPGNPLLLLLGVLSVLIGILLNDEFQRRTIDSLRRGRRGGSIALLGIDGSGKSSHSVKTLEWLSRRGYYSSMVQFHRYLFVDTLSRKGRSGQERGEGGSGNPLRPLLSLLDNLILNLGTSFGSGLEGRVVVYDRYIWSTYVKYAALQYPVRPIRSLYLFPRPRLAIVLDIPVERSLNVIGTRQEHIRYQSEVLAEERRQYLSIAKERGYPVIDSTGDFDSVQRQIEAELLRVFPRAFEAKT